MEKNTHPNRNWRKSWRMQPNQVDELESWPATILQYIKIRGWTRKQFIQALCISEMQLNDWLSGDETPPPYLMLALSALD